MDCSVVPTRFPDLLQVSTTDFFFPIVEHPYLLGRIACANVLSDLYAMGIDHCDNMLMLLGVSTDMTALEQKVTTTMIIQGFNDTAEDAGTSVTGGQTVKNPWPLIGGVAFSLQKQHELILPENALPGDVLVLTKPLGINVVVGLKGWLRKPEKWEQVGDVATAADAEDMYDIGVKSMARLNRTGAQLMKKHGAHAATDVTGFGILGHLENLAKATTVPVDMCLHTLPCIHHTYKASLKFSHFKLERGYCAETSGGLLVALPRDRAQPFIDDIVAAEGWPAWIVGDVTAGQGRASLSPSITVVEVDRSSIPALKSAAQ